MGSDGLPYSLAEIGAKMFVLIERDNDGSWDECSMIGAFDTKEEATAAMKARVAEVESNYTDWRGGAFDSEWCCDTDDYVNRGYEFEPDLFRWYVFDTDEHYRRIAYSPYKS